MYDVVKSYLASYKHSERGGFGAFSILAVYTVQVKGRPHKHEK